MAVAALALAVFAPPAAGLTPKQLEMVRQLQGNAEELIRAGKFREAVPVLENIVEIDPSDETSARRLTYARQRMVETFCARADEAYVQGDYQRAMNEWYQILERYPEDMRILGMLDFARNTVQDTYIDSLRTHANELLAQGDIASALILLEKILLVQPEDAHTRELMISSRQMQTNKLITEKYQAAERYESEKQFDLAIEAWKAILEIDRTQQEASRRIAEARRMKLDEMYKEARLAYEGGRYEASLDLYNKITVENPTDAEAKQIIGRINGVVKIVHKADEEGRAYDMLRLALANYIQPGGNVKAAIAATWYAGQLSPENTSIAAVRDFLERAFPTAVLTLEAPVEDMTLVDQYLFASLNHIYEGRYDLAVQECSIVLALDPKNMLAYKRLGSAYFAMGRKDKAREAWEKALGITPDDVELKQFMKLLY